MNGIESYILNKFKREEMGWLPVGRSISLDHLDTNQSEEIEDKIEGILGKIETIEQIFGEDSDESTADEEHNL